ncbi:MAG: TCR/Tet family MFS transporter [Flavipsychrobacter sp.]
MTVKRTNALGFIFITILIDVIGLGIIIPVFPKLIQGLTGASLSQASTIGGWLSVVYAFMQFLCSPILGGLSDRFGRRPVLLISLLGLGVDYVFQAAAPTIGWLFLGRIIAGMCGASFTTATAYIADISTPEKRAQNFGLVGAAFGLGFIIGPAIGGICGQWGPRIPFVVAACFSLLNFLYGYFILPESLEKDHRRDFNLKRANPLGSLKQLRRYPIVSGLVISFTLIYLSGQAVQSTWAYFTMLKFNWSTQMVGYSLSVVGVLIALVQGGLIRVTIPAFGQKNSVYIGLALYTVALVLFAFAYKGWMMYAFLVPYCLGGIAGPALQGIISSQVPHNEQGELQGALTSLMSLTTIFGPLMMNNLFAWFTSKAAPVYFPGAAFMAGAVLMFISIFFAVPSLKSYHLSTKQTIVPATADENS